MSRESVVTECFIQHEDALPCDTRCPFCRLEAASKHIPDDSVVVPKEPTYCMVTAGIEKFRFGEERLMSYWVSDMYKAMLKAAEQEGE